MKKILHWYWNEVFIEADRSRAERVGTAGIFLMLVALLIACAVNLVNSYYDHFLYNAPITFITVDVALLAVQRFFMRMSFKAQRKRHSESLREAINNSRRLTLRLTEYGSTYWACVDEHGATTRIYTTEDPTEDSDEVQQND